MTNPTSNYNFQMPTATDLVTDLPADFEVFGQAVDTRLKALQPGTTLGDLAYSSATANTNTRLPIGTSGQVLAVSGGVPAWTTTSDVTPLTTKGDLFTFTTVDARLGVGANNTVLTADSAEATGMKWATPAAGGLTQLATGSLSTNITTISSISGSYKDLVIRLDDVVTSANGGIYIRFNSDSASNYLYSYTDSKSGTVGSSGAGDTGLLVLPTLNSTATEVQIMATVYNYASSATYKVANWNSVGLHPISSPIVTSFDGGGGYKATTAITSVSIKAESTNTLTGTYYIYGVN